ncbi:GAF domain-containing protein [Acetobacterium sp.]|uniref:GAF domain-containing protein n=1 Tax=Acetobacterium sp. TaxID=1872094 RepID=UPI002F426ED2
MSLKMCNLLDVEKYLLLELVYFHLPSTFKSAISRETPMMLDLYIDLIDQCSHSMYPGFVNRSQRGRKFAKLRQAYFRRIYATSENLGDIMITGYMNDNHGPFGNTVDQRKTSFVGLAFEDSENNGAVSFSGCEQMYPSSMMLDWCGCLAASLGFVTGHHTKALNFYDKHMQGISGERNILGHSKGGNLGTYVFINRLNENTNAYCVNAQPYCWRTMNNIQKEALKTERFEYIVHANDPTKKAGYVSYISRTAPLNRYATKGFINIHGLAEVNFDEFGNLEGTRVIREITDKLKAKFFKDYSCEKHFSHDECIKRFQMQIESSNSIPRLFSTTMDEALMVTNALASILWLKDVDSEGEFIYPLIIKSPVADEFYQLKLREGNGIASQCVFQGLPLFIRDSKRYEVHFEGMDHAMGITITSEIAVPLGVDEKDVFGALELINKKNGFFTVEDFALVNDMTLAMLDVFRKTGQTFDSCRDFTLLRIQQGRERLFSIEKHGYKEFCFSSTKEKDTFLKMICGEKLEKDQVLVFNRRKFNASMKAELKVLRSQEYSEIFLPPKYRDTNKSVETVLRKHFLYVRNRSKRIVDLAEKVGLQHKLKTIVKNLTDAEYVLLEYAVALIKEPMLIIVNTPIDGLDKDAYEAVCNRLKQDCLNKMITVIVLRL